MAWLFLFVAGILEIIWASGLKASDGFTRLTPSLITIAAMIVSFSFLALAMRELPLGTAYAVWTGIGTVGAALVGIAVYGDAASPMRMACIGLIVLGIAGLKLSEA